MLSSILTLTALVASTLGAPSSSYVQHEKRDVLPPGWEREQKLPGHEILPMRIALSQSNMDRADEFLMDVSHPESPNFGYVDTDPSNPAMRTYSSLVLLALFSWSPTRHFPNEHYLEINFS